MPDSGHTEGERARLTTRERRERRADRRHRWAESRDDEAEAASKRAQEIGQRFEFGQPIILGHHSEARARRDRERVDSAMFQSLEHARMAQKHNESAATIERQLDESIYSDDEDAVAQLRARIADREEQRRHARGINVELRKTGSLEGLVLTKDEEDAIVSAAQMYGRKEIPSWYLQNLGRSIGRDRKRLTQLIAELGEEQEAADLPSDYRSRSKGRAPKQDATQEDSPEPEHLTRATRARDSTVGPQATTETGGVMATTVATTRGIEEIPTDLIDVRPSAFQARETTGGQSFNEGLVQGLVKQYDRRLLDPVGLYPNPDVSGRYILTEGHHRLETVRRVGEATIPARVADVDASDPEEFNRLKQEAVLSNFRGGRSSLRELSNTVGILQDTGMTPQEIASRMRTHTQPEVERLLDLHRLGPSAVDRINAQPELTVAGQEIGRAMRLYPDAYNEENAQALLLGFAKHLDEEGKLPGMATIRGQLKNYAIQAREHPQGMQGNGGMAYPE